MGRKKIKIESIFNENLRRTTFSKRRDGILKKVAEICMLCNVQAQIMIEDLDDGLIIFNSGSSEIQNSSNQFKKMFENYNTMKINKFNLQDYPNFFTKKTYQKCVQKRLNKQLYKTNNQYSDIQSCEQYIQKQCKEENTLSEKYLKDESIFEQNLEKSLSQYMCKDRKTNEVPIDKQLPKIKKIKKNSLKINIPQDSQHMIQQMNIIKCLNDNPEQVQSGFNNIFMKNLNISNLSAKNLQNSFSYNNSAFKMFKSPLISRDQQNTHFNQDQFLMDNSVCQISQYMINMLYNQSSNKSTKSIDSQKQ